MDSEELRVECERVESYAQSLGLKLVLVVKICLTSSGVLLLMLDLFTKKYRHRIIYHPNAKTICNFVRFFLFVICLGYLTIHSYDLFRFCKNAVSPCDRLASMRVVVALRMITTVATVAQIVAYVILAIERITCTFWLVQYEKANRPHAIFAILVVFTTLYSTFAYFMLFSKANANASTALSASKLAGYPWGYTTYSWSLLSGELSILFLFLAIRVWNSWWHKKVRRADMALMNQKNLLSMKFQINETIKTLDCFLPIVFGQICFYTLTIVGGMIFNGTDAPAILAILNEAFFVHFLSAHVFACVRLAKSGYFRLRFARTGARNQVKPIEAVESNEDFYRRQMAMFEATPTKMQRV